jgi:hypothetical protein
MPPTTPAVTSPSKKSADTRWIFDGESALHVSSAFFHRYSQSVCLVGSVLQLLMPPRRQRGDAANVRAWDIFSSSICVLKRQIAQHFLHLKAFCTSRLFTPYAASEPLRWRTLKQIQCAQGRADPKRLSQPNEQQRDSARIPPGRLR